MGITKKTLLLEKIEQRAVERGTEIDRDKRVSVQAKKATKTKLLTKFITSSR